MRAIVIDPDKKTFEEIHIAVEDRKGVARTIGCKSFTTGAFLNGSLTTGGDILYVSDDYLEENGASRSWFQIDVDRNPPSSYPINGRGVVMGFDRDGEDADAKISLDQLRARVTFTTRKLRGYDVSGSGSVDDPLIISRKAPLIDGENEDKKARLTDAEKEELQRIADAAGLGGVAVEDVIEEARDEDNVLHHFFVWDADGAVHGGQQLGKHIRQLAAGIPLAKLKTTEAELTTLRDKYDEDHGDHEGRFDVWAAIDNALDCVVALRMQAEAWPTIADELDRPGGYQDRR
jgi:hypothetical protein